jgi:hypothetical protein
MLSHIKNNKKKKNINKRNKTINNKRNKNININKNSQGQQQVQKNHRYAKKQTKATK